MIYNFEAVLKTVGNQEFGTQKKGYTIAPDEDTARQNIIAEYGECIINLKQTNVIELCTVETI